MQKAFINGKVYVEKGMYAQAILVKDGMIQAVGADEEILQLAEEKDGGD